MSKINAALNLDPHDPSFAETLEGLNLSDEELTQLIATLDARVLCADFQKLHVAFLEAQAIVMQVSWGKDAIKEAVLKTS